MSPAVSVAKAKPAVLGAGAVDGGDIGTAVGVVPVFLRLPELEEPLSHTHELHGTYLPILQQNEFFFLETRRDLSFIPSGRERWFLRTFLWI